MKTLIAAALLIVAAGCSTVPVASNDPIMPGGVPESVETTASTSSDTSMPTDPTGGSAPIEDTAAPSSLGASSSGRGH